MKITKVIHIGNIRYRVNEAQGPNGKRLRKFFETKESAENYVKARTADARAFGVHFATIPPNERAALAYHLERLKRLGWTLPMAVDYIEKHGKEALSVSISLEKLKDEFMAAKESAGLRPRYVKTLRASIKRFLLGRREKLVSDITAAEIQEYISSNGWEPATMRSYLVDVRTLFAFAVKRKYFLQPLHVSNQRLFDSVANEELAQRGVIRELFYFPPMDMQLLINLRGGCATGQTSFREPLLGKSSCKSLKESDRFQVIGLIKCGLECIVQCFLELWKS